MHSTRATHHRILTLAGLVGVLSLSACSLRGSGTAMTETRALDEFDAIELGGAFSLIVHVDPGAAQKVEVSGDDNIVPEIVTRVSGGELDVSLDHWMVRPKEPMKIEVWVSSLTELEASGAANIEVEGVHGERFELELSGASDSTISGSVDRFEIDSSGTSHLKAHDLEAKTIELDLSGAGDVEVWASERLDAEISGAGKVRYWGDPGEVNKQVSGAGSIEPGSR
ncbi:hypothetical protein ENSA5_10430 [Enhygromyxa salina]|uniref:Putative auto-transporter adhesin head GIN domain-containing protein n=1 Tax=Enhygromyxa salina TaxID=215803 RepID=A0A2S9YGB9_9BACT|nr:head GIN domain-containing protein [Enhygromyxa salina]PRQ04153.1 hypothetical protein ENSA5_10430 [Enhygromyxa salina]